mmetsp:Transcript_18582/g.41208  ORF Transcript_18582/g.41208 Transcript_18582/m.41208 type:complete len:82 (-) Transcript_18582:296-541(-)
MGGRGGSFERVDEQLLAGRLTRLLGAASFLVSVSLWGSGSTRLLELVSACRTIGAAASRFYHRSQLVSQSVTKELPWRLFS